MELQWWIATIGVPLAGFFFVCLSKLSTRLADTAKNLHGRIDMMAGMFGDYREKAAERFAARADVARLEENIEARLDRIETKIDRLATARGGHG